MATVVNNCVSFHDNRESLEHLRDILSLCSHDQVIDPGRFRNRDDGIHNVVAGADGEQGATVADARIVVQDALDNYDRYFSCEAARSDVKPTDALFLNGHGSVAAINAIRSQVDDLLPAEATKEYLRRATVDARLMVAAEGRDKANRIQPLMHSLNKVTERLPKLSSEQRQDAEQQMRAIFDEVLPGLVQVRLDRARKEAGAGDVYGMSLSLMGAADNIGPYFGDAAKYIDPALVARVEGDIVEIKGIGWVNGVQSSLEDLRYFAAKPADYANKDRWVSSYKYFALESAKNAEQLGLSYTIDGITGDFATLVQVIDNILAEHQ